MLIVKAAVPRWTHEFFKEQMSKTNFSSIMTVIQNSINISIVLLQIVALLNCEQSCNINNADTSSCSSGTNQKKHLYSKEANQHSPYLDLIKGAVASYKPCSQKNCSCHAAVIAQDLAAFKDGITKEMIDNASKKGTKYQIIDHRLYRDAECMFPARCSGIEHFLLPLLPELPDMEMIVNTRDWPQVSRHFGEHLAVFSFSKTRDYLDITYPTWGFWEGGPAIKLYPRGLGRWDLLRGTLAAAAAQWPWAEKYRRAFFRGSRTSGERDELVLLSREEPGLVDAQYTKNQAWKSDADTLYAPPAGEVSLESHCRHRYLFNFRGVAASFRLKHLFLCRSLVFHVGDEWEEFFYPAMRPWVHYVPVPAAATRQDIRALLEFASANPEVSREIADRGYDFIWKHLRMKDVQCYWRKLLVDYAELLAYKPVLDATLVERR